MLVWAYVSHDWFTLRRDAAHIINSIGLRNPVFDLLHLHVRVHIGMSGLGARHKDR